MSIKIIERRRGVYPSMPEIKAPWKWEYTCDGCGRADIQNIGEVRVGDDPIASAMLSLMPHEDVARRIGDIGVFHYCRGNLLCLRDASMKVMKQHLDERITEDGQVRPGPYSNRWQEVEAVKHDVKRGACNVPEGRDNT